MKLSQMIGGDVVKAYFGKPYLNWESMVNFKDVSPFIMDHLKKVYFTLYFVLLSSFLGSVLHFFQNVGGPITLVGFIGCLMWFRSTQPWRERKRVFLLIAAAFFGGASVEFLISPFISVDLVIIITVLGETAVALGCFTAAASWRLTERNYTYSYGGVYALILIAIWLSVAPRLFSEKYIFALYFFAPYIGSWYVLCHIILHSQEMVEQTRRGNHHHSEHCATFFTDFPAIFFRFWYILVTEVYAVYNS